MYRYARRTIVLTGVLAALGASTLTGCAGSGGARAAGAASANLRAGRAEVIATSQTQITGVAVTGDGRVFISAPRWHTDGPMSSVMEVMPGGELRAYPDARWNSWTPGSPDAGATAGTKFVCVQSVHVDAKGRLWVLDPASPRLGGVVPGGAKLVQIDPAGDGVMRQINFDARVAPPDSYLNDVRIDVRTETAYITDSGRGGIVVVDLASGEARRVLDADVRTKAFDIVPVLEGKELRFVGGPNAGKPPRIHSDGIALSPGADYLYWQALTSRRLYRAPTAWLRGTDGRPERLAQLVEDLGETVMTDGMEIDSRGNIYFAAVEKDAVMVRRPDGRMETLAQGPCLAWPDTFAIRRRPGDGSGDELYVTTSQIHRSEWFRADGQSAVGGYLVLKMRVAK